MSKLTRGAFVATCLLLVHTADATTVLPISLRQTVQRAGIIFWGPLRSVTSGIVQTQKAHTIVSTVEFTDLEVVRGDRSRATLSLRLFGGTADGQGVRVDGMPSFEVGSRHVILAASDGGSERNNFLPIVGL